MATIAMEAMVENKNNDSWSSNAFVVCINRNVYLNLQLHLEEECQVESVEMKDIHRRETNPSRKNNWAVSLPKRFSTNEANVSRLQTLYSLVQCTPDLSSPDCNRYAVYPFYNLTAVAIAAPPPQVVTSSGSVIIPKVGVTILFFIVGYCLLTRRTRKKNNPGQGDNVGTDITTIKSLQYDLNTIEVATNKFADSKKLGEGGFGVVYKGSFLNGKDIAVKRLSKSSGQSAEEFKNEVLDFYGYISPEFAMHGRFSEKSDVFSFGVLMLEIVCGKMNTGFCNSNHSENLLTHAWKHWKGGTIGLLCVQENPTGRPTMTRVVTMLSSSSVTLPVPQKNPFFFGSITGLSSGSVELEWDRNMDKSTSCSVDDASITRLYPR
ncbi:hypothetical protein SLEP1_g49238 [Rubroshorea leprosula]|uniref:Serine-threonine/tyrosine-protein kinase catalytic domain-containing protein n=1 Tax=Rubroshorea leprosula TaxID=152421 RepID=A0AAV5LZF4_9ROSI|nr:hypothetical protein SLEP1_g49238 [Rubroshorea leprosula]